MSEERICFELVRSDRRTCQIQVKADGRIVVRAPRRMPYADIERFVAQKADWIEKCLGRIERYRAEMPDPTPLTDADIDSLADRALEVIPQRVAHFAGVVGVCYGRITIRNQRTRWGSCSREGNLNFNCLLMLMPDDVVDYVVVHELCHIKEMNHSRAFWECVEEALPSYKESRAWLKRHGGAIIARMTANQ